MNVVFVCGTDPRSTTYGGEQRTHLIWKGLQKLGTVWTIVPVAHPHQARVFKADRVVYSCLERRYTVGWLVQRILYRLFPQLPIPFGVRKLQLEEYGITQTDCCVSRTMYIAGRYSLWNVAPLYVDVDDTPTVDYHTRFPKRKIRLKLLSFCQGLISARSTQLWVPDQDQMIDFPSEKIKYLPNIPLQPQEYGCRHPDRNRLLFVGLLAHYPNIVAIDWFLTMFWCDLKARFPDMVIDIVGGGLPISYKERWGSLKDVRLHGFVADLDVFYNCAHALITPMRIGSGTCIKVLESLGRGCPVISTDIGLRGIPREDRIPTNGIFTFADLRTLINGIEIIKISTCNPRQYIREKFSEDVINKKISSFLQDSN